MEGTPRDSNDASISNEDDNTIVAKLLEGHLKQTISARSVKGGEETVFQDAKVALVVIMEICSDLVLFQFLHIILDISHGDLWSAMDSYTSSMELEDYVGSGEFSCVCARSFSLLFMLRIALEMRQCYQLFEL